MELRANVSLITVPSKSIVEENQKNVGKRV